MDEMVILCAIMVVGPFFLFIVMVCSLKIFGYLNIDLFKPDTSSASEAENARQRERSGYTNGEVIYEDILNEQYAFRDRWTTGLSIAANLPTHIAMTEIPLSISVPNSNARILNPSYSRPQIRGQPSVYCPVPAHPIRRTDMSIPTYHEVIQVPENSEPPPPDYYNARLLQELQADQNEIPPPTYTECMQLKIQKICSLKL